MGKIILELVPGYPPVPVDVELGQHGLHSFGRRHVRAAQLPGTKQLGELRGVDHPIVVPVDVLESCLQGHREKFPGRRQAACHELRPFDPAVPVEVSSGGRLLRVERPDSDRAETVGEFLLVDEAVRIPVHLMEDPRQGLNLRSRELGSSLQSRRTPQHSVIPVVQEAVQLVLLELQDSARFTVLIRRLREPSCPDAVQRGRPKLLMKLKHVRHQIKQVGVGCWHLLQWRAPLLRLQEVIHAHGVCLSGRREEWVHVQNLASLLIWDVEGLCVVDGEDHAAQAPNVALVREVPLDHLRRHRRQRARPQFRAGPLAVLRPEKLRQPDVDDHRDDVLEAAFRGDLRLQHDVFKLEVLVHDTFCVAIANGFQRLPENACNPRLWQRPLSIRALLNEIKQLATSAHV
mmetsp:Transcript_52947/g.133794  ORF Transcript_52947/g.133794 Transcript_52947/m.133794 type:complete len:403 (-) Transcript_52947:1147-2355(-)